MAETTDKPKGPISLLELMRPEEITISRLWSAFARTYFGPGVPVQKVQYEETRKAFILGFGECFQAVTDLSGGLPENEAELHLTRLHEELVELVGAIQAEELEHARKRASGLILPPSSRL